MPGLRYVVGRVGECWLPLTRGGQAVTFPGDVGKFVAELVVAVVGPWVLKKIRDRDLREAIAHAADAALVLAIKKSNKFADYGDLIRAVVDGILEDPSAPKQVKKSPELAERAAAAAIARNSVGMTSLVGDR
jgi:hypothetical protein